MRADDARREPMRAASCTFSIAVDARLLEHVGGELVGEDQRVAGLRPIVGRRVGDAIEAVGDLRREADRAVARQRPRRGRPDDDARAPAHEIEGKRGGVLVRARTPVRRAPPETSPTPYRWCNPRTRPRLRRARSSPPRSTSPASSRDRACRSPRTSSARARSAPRPESSSSCRDDPSRPRRRAA